MPDISGFTKFVQSTEIEHSQHIIAELLELLIDQNESDLELAEIEGDALFYYKYQDTLSPERVIAQAKRMYQAFHKHLTYYENHRICQCGACRTAEELELKFVVHGGNFEFIKVKDTRKPYGPDVIKAHRLLKNNVDSDEYILVSDDLTAIWKEAGDEIDQEQWTTQSVTMDMGEVGYSYFTIEGWRDNLHEVPLSFIGQRDVPITAFEMDINAEPNYLFEVLSNFKYRNDWNSGVDGIEYDEDRVNRAGSKHVCIIGNKSIEFETIKGDAKPGQLVYGERTENVPGFDYMDSYFILQPADDSTHLEAKLMGKPSGFLGKLIRPFMSLQLKKQLKQTVGRLKDLVESE